MAGRIWIPPYKPLGVGTQAVPGGGYINVDASAGNFGPSPLAQLGLEVAEGAVGITKEVAKQISRDNEAIVKAADMRLGEAEQAMLFDPRDGYLNAQGEAAVKQAPDVLDAYREVQRRELDTMADDEQRQMLEDVARRRLTTFNERVERHSAAERLRWHDAMGDQRIAQMRTDAGLYWSDDALLRRALGTTRAEVKARGEDRGWDAALTETTMRQQTSRVLVSAIEAAVERDPKRAQSVRTRYFKHIEENDSAALDALLSEAQTRERAQAASIEILNATPPDGEQPTPQWRLQQAEAIAEPAIRSATIRRLQSAATADEARARTQAEQVLARVLKDNLSDPSQIPVRQWVTLGTEHRQAIETRLDHNARGDEPAPNPDLVDELTTQMTHAPQDFARRDLVPAVAYLPLPQWQRFRDWQAGIRRDDPTTRDELYAIKRGLQLAQRTPPDGEPAGNNDTGGPPASALFRAALVEEIDTARKLAGKSPDDAALRAMVRRSLPEASIHNIHMPMDPELARRLGALPGQALDALSFLFLMMFLQSLQLKVGGIDRTAPRSPPVPVPPPPADGRSSQKKTALPEDLKDVWRNPPHVQPTMPSPVLPGRPIAPPQKPVIEGYPIPEPSKPEVVPAPPPVIPPGPIIETLPQIDAKPEIMTSDNEAAKPSSTHNLPRHEECIRAVHECLSAPNMSPGLRRECLKKENECNERVAHIRELHDRAPDVSGAVKFPDGT